MEKTAVLVGAGALGSHALLFARNLPLRWVVVDFDRVEQKNVLAQLHPKGALGKNKAEALRQTLLGLFGTKIEAIPHRLVPDNTAALLGRADVVIDAVDNGATRRLIQAFVREKGTPCLHAAASADGAYGRVVWDPIFRVDDEAVPGAATCEDGATLPFHGLVGAAVAGVLQRWLVDDVYESLQVAASVVTVLDRR